jgi:hypothetical protein
MIGTIFVFGRPANRQHRPGSMPTDSAKFDGTDRNWLPDGLSRSMRPNWTCMTVLALKDRTQLVPMFLARYSVTEARVEMPPEPVRSSIWPE